MLSYDRVRELFDYDQESGFLYNKVYRGSKALKGNPVGNKRMDGYLQLCIDRKMYRVNRIIWLWYYGYNPENIIDHINRDITDNRITNLREASKQCNAVNVDNYSHNKSGVRGVSFNIKANKWEVGIKVNQSHKFLGYYSDLLEAACTRLAAEQCLKWETCTTSSACRYVQDHINKI